jgi:hypothetical protein
VIENDERQWQPQEREQLQQLKLFDSFGNIVQAGQSTQVTREVIRKLPYKFYYRFLAAGDSNPRKLMIEDWEIGALYWNCLNNSGGDEKAAKQLVRQKYFDEFVNSGNKDLYLFLGTTKVNHNIAPNPFIIIGVFYSPS